MNVKELIEELQRYEPDKEVRVYEKNHPFGETYAIDNISFEMVYEVKGRHCYAPNKVLINMSSDKKPYIPQTFSYV